MRARGRGRGRGRGSNNHFERSPPRRRRSPHQERAENFYCVFCKVQLSSVRLFEDHNKAAVHKQKEILIEKAFSDGLHFCYTCEKIFPSKIELDAHCLMSRHQPLYRNDELQELMNRKQQVVVESTDIGSESDIRRARDDKDRHDIVLKLNKLREDENKDYDALNNSQRKKKEHFCDMCNVDCLNSANYKIHVASWRHRAEVDKKNDEERKQFDEEAERVFNKPDTDTERIKVPSHLTDTVQYFCEVCSVPFTGEESYLEHTKGRKHLRQVSQMRRPYKCYICTMEFSVEKEFNYHLESRSHMNKAFKKGSSTTSSSSKGKSKDKSDEWVEKKSSKHRSSDRSESKEHRDRRSGDRRDDRRHSDRKNPKDQSASNSKDGTKSKDDRKVEIVKSPAVESGITDLREKLQGKTLMVTTTHNLAEKGNAQGADVPSKQSGDDRIELEKRAKELEFETKFKKISKEYQNDQEGLKERMTKEREIDIAAYQQYENTYRRLCEEEDFIRENLRILEEGDPRKEEYIRDMIRIQRDMREVRQELEFREMMIIKRESLFRENFPNSTDNKVVINQGPTTEAVVIDYHHGSASAEQSKAVSEPMPTPPLPASNSAAEPGTGDNDLRIQLERERLMKRLGPELDSIDPSIREKLLSAIFDKESGKAAAVTENQSKDKRQVVKGEKPQDKMQYLTAREKQLEKELAELKTTKVTKSLVPQYDDVDEKNKNVKKRVARRRTRSPSSDSSRSSSSSSDSRYNKKDKKRRKSSPVSKSSRNKSKRSGSTSPDRGRKKRKRSYSRERERRKKPTAKKGKDDDKKKKSDRSKSERKKPLKITVKPRQKDNKLSRTDNPLPGDSDSDMTEQHISTIPVMAAGVSSAVSPLTQAQAQAISVVGQSQAHVPPPIQRREQFSLWKNPAVVAAPPKASPKEDVWDIAFSGGQVKEVEAAETLNLFNSNPEASNQLPMEILNILRNVAPIMQQNPAFAIPSSSTIQSVVSGMNKANVDNPTWNPPPSELSRGSNLSVSEAGVKVRSILKKMKEPVIAQPPIQEPSSLSVESNAIPGLEYVPSAADTRSDNRVLEQKGFEPQKHKLSTEVSRSNEGSPYPKLFDKKDLSSSYREGSPSARQLDSRSIDSRVDDRFKGVAESVLGGEVRAGAHSPWTVKTDTGRRVQEDEASISSVGSYGKYSTRAGIRPDEITDRRIGERLNDSRERSVVSGIRPIRVDDPYRPDNLAARDDLREPLFRENMDRLRPELGAAHIDSERRPVERDLYTRPEEILRGSHASKRAHYFKGRAVR